MDKLIYNFADFWSELSEFWPDRNWNYDLRLFRSVVAMIVGLIIAYWIIQIANRFLPRIAEKITDTAAARSHGDKLLAVRRTETLLNAAAAAGKFLLIVIIVYISWRIVNPGGAPLAIIGTTAIVFIVGYGTVTPLLKDVFNGVIMITEKWYEVGDYVVLDPFWELSGVVEQINLRATKLRSLKGEIIHIHNQSITAARVTPRGLRTISIDIFVKDLEKGRKLVERVASTLPMGPAMIATNLKITSDEKLGDNLWRVTATGQTAPGREWLIEEFAVKALSMSDESDYGDKVLFYEPITRYTDEAAERRFLRSIKGRAPSQKKKKQHKDYISKIEEI